VAIWSTIPDDAIAWFHNAFADANRKVAEALVNVPNIRETSLDDTFIQALIPHSAPTLLDSGVLVRMDIHNIGGLRRMWRWEVADIGILVFVIRARRIIARKIGFLQAKRLYPTNDLVDDEDPTGFQYGMNAFLKRDPSPLSMALSQRFEFHSQCRYGAIQAKSDQVLSINNFSQQSGYPVHYLLYNPHKLPIMISYPVSKRQVLRRVPAVGCRVVPAPTIHSLLSRLTKGSTLTFQQIQHHAGNDFWQVQHWAADLMLSCKVGREIGPEDEEIVRRMIERRAGPIGAAIAMNIELPSD